MKMRTPAKKRKSSGAANQKNAASISASKTPSLEMEDNQSNNIEEDPLGKQMRESIAQISERLVRVEPKHQKVNDSLRAIRSQGARLLGPGSKISQSSKAKLIALYQTAQRQCESENATLEQLLASIQKVRELNLKQRMSDKLSRGTLMVLLAQHAASLPLYIGGIDGHPPPLVGAIPQLSGEPIPVGHFVAAFVEDVWILAEIKSQLSPTRYLIRDIDDEEEGGGGEEEGEKQLTILANRLIPLPHHRADPRRHAHALFPKSAIVLALYPQTTCFYKGIVETPPTGPNDDYLIAFEDSTFTTGYSPTLPVPQLYVLTHKNIFAPRSHHRKKTQSPAASSTTATAELTDGGDEASED